MMKLNDLGITSREDRSVRASAQSDHSLCLVLMEVAKGLCFFMQTVKTDQTGQMQGRLIYAGHKAQMSRIMRKPTFWFPTWFDSNQAVQLQKMARGLKFQI